MTVSAASNQVTGVSLGATPQRTRTYAPGGNLLTDAYVGGISYAYSYNAAGRMIGVTQNGTAAGAYGYDFEGQRVWRQTFGVGGAQMAYVHDQAGHLIAEHDAATGAATREYIWLDDKPVALADISGGVTSVGYIHTGQIDEPLEVTDASGAVAWNAAADPFGAATVSPGATTALDMRLPGQSLQLEAGSLSQNHWRDYDPSLGRYAEADPLGIEAGPNVYGYVDGDPVNGRDPEGLSNEWTTAATMTWDWATGTGPTRRSFGPESVQAQEMQNAFGLDRARAAYRRKNAGKSCRCNTGRQGDRAPLTDYGPGFGLAGLFASGLNPTQQFVGGYEVNIRPLTNCKRMIVISNRSSIKSFLYDHGPAYERSTFGPGGNAYQTYWWIEDDDQ